jgi:hypothetical protein
MHDVTYVTSRHIVDLCSWIYGGMPTHNTTSSDHPELVTVPYHSAGVELDLRCDGFDSTAGWHSRGYCSQHPQAFRGLIPRFAPGISGGRHRGDALRCVLARSADASLASTTPKRESGRRRQRRCRMKCATRSVWRRCRCRLLYIYSSHCHSTVILHRALHGNLVGNCCHYFAVHLRV